MQSSGPSQHQHVPSLVAASVASHWATTVALGLLACAFALNCLPLAQSQRGPFPILNRSLEKAGCSMNVYCIHGKVSFLLTKGLWESKTHPHKHYCPELPQVAHCTNGDKGPERPGPWGAEPPLGGQKLGPSSLAKTSFPCRPREDRSPFLPQVTNLKQLWELQSVFQDLFLS